MDNASYYSRNYSVLGSISSYEPTISSYNSIASANSRSTVIPATKSNFRTQTEIGYRAVLGRLAEHGVPTIPIGDIKRSSNKAYGAGASLIVYPGKWRDSRKAEQPSKVVVLKYMHNVMSPQGVSRIQACVNDMNGRLKSICLELDAMVGKEGKFYANFPRLFGVAWEEILSPAGIYLYRPVMVAEAAICDLEAYVRQGSLTGHRRHKDELRFITSVYDAMNFLHQECDFLHGDLKPANVLVFQNQQTGLPDLKLADFGLAYTITERMDPKDGRMQGTPYWSAPETYPNTPLWLVSLHPATQDYYSFGLIVWFILFGYPLGDLRSGYSEEDAEIFQLIKQQGMFIYEKRQSSKDRSIAVSQGSSMDLLEMLGDIYRSKWKWEILDRNAIKQLKDVEDQDGDSSDSDDDGKDASEVRGELFEKLIANGKIRELEYDSKTSTWVPTKDHFHHIYRALLETALQQKADDRRTVLHKPSEELLTRNMTNRLAALSVIGHSDPKSEVFSAWSMMHNPTSLQSLHRLEVQQWSKKQKHTESGIKDLSQPLTAEVVKALPLKMAESLLTEMIQEAGVSTQVGLPRQYLLANILAFQEKLPHATDYRSWWKEYAKASPAPDRLHYVLGQLLTNKPIDDDEAHEWALEGLTTFPQTEIGDQLQKVFEAVEPSLLMVPVRCAIWDYTTELAINTPKGPGMSRRSDIPIFQSIIDGDSQACRTLAQAQGKLLPTTFFDDCDVLHFAIIHRRMDIVRYLMVEEDLVIGEGTGYQKVFQSLLHDPDASTVIYEMNRCYHLATKKMFTRDQMRNRVLDPLSSMFRCELVAMVAGIGSRSFMDILDNDYRDGLRIMSSFNLHSTLEESEGGSDGDCNPLFSALQCRRLPAFMKILNWGPVRSRPTFSPNAVVNGFPLLHHAIAAMAPFFVAALLANNADPNQIASFEAGYEISPLHHACIMKEEEYRESLGQRKELHEMMGFPQDVIEQDELALTNSGSDIEALRTLIITLLLKNGADINKGIRSLPGAVINASNLMTPLQWCIQNKRSEVAMLLIENGADINTLSSNLTLLHRAINQDLTMVARALLERGASPDGRSTQSPPLMTALLCNRPELFKLLLDKGASLEIKPPEFEGDLLVHALLESTSEFLARNLTPLDRLQAMQTASANSLDEYIKGRRHLRDILYAHLVAMPKTKLRRLINLPSQEGAIAIHFAAEYIHGSEEGDIKLMELIIEHTQDLQARGVGYSALERALVLGNQSFLEIFLALNMRRMLVTGQ